MQNGKFRYLGIILPYREIKKKKPLIVDNHAAVIFYGIGQ